MGEIRFNKKGYASLIKAGVPIEVADGLARMATALQAARSERDWLLAEATDEVRARYFALKGRT